MSRKKFKIVILLIMLFGLSYLFKSSLYDFAKNVVGQNKPCQRPITYSIGKFDARFGISKNNFLKDIEQAAQVWETPLDKKLFAYDSDSGTLAINLIYDYRQDATVRLGKLGITINSDEMTYGMLKDKYDSLQSEYNQQKSDLQTEIGMFQNEKSMYDSKVQYWNSLGGAPETEYKKLEQEKAKLNIKADEINQLQNNLNNTIDDINATATVLNQLASELNLNVQKYNTIGASQSSEFLEGDYKSTATGTEIDIYQFDNKDKLIRVLEHELGHALGLGHVDNPKAIMYRMNQGSNTKLTADDIAALKKICGISE